MSRYQLMNSKTDTAGGEGACRASRHGVPAEIPVSDFFSGAPSKLPYKSFMLISMSCLVLDRPFQSAGLQKQT